MKLIRILRHYSKPNLLRQTPDNAGMWENYQFVIDKGGSCDYGIVLHGVRNPISLECNPLNIWAIMQEPPTEFNKPIHKGFDVYNRIFTQDISLRSDRYIWSQPALPWHVNKTYNELVNCPIPQKQNTMSWVTSNSRQLHGHRLRMGFLERIHTQLDFHLYGRGFVYLEDKWDGIAPYYYSLAIENHRNPYYWSEKIADCFLSWTMPIYYGSEQISNYFPLESMICIDIEDKDVVEKINSAVGDNSWKRNLDAIEYSRKLVLEKYQLFPMLTGLINSWEVCIGEGFGKKKNVLIPPLPSIKKPFAKKLISYVRRCYNIWK